MITPFLVVMGIAFYFIGAGFMSGVFTTIYYKTDYIADHDIIFFMSFFWPIGVLYIAGRVSAEYVVKNKDQ